MNARKYTSIAVFAFVLLIFGCVTPQHPVEAGFSCYQENSEQAEADSVVAIISYSSADIALSDFYAISEFEGYFDAYFANMERLGSISDNYSVEPNEAELKVCITFTDAWLDYIEGLRGLDARQDYIFCAEQLILQISDFEYQNLGAQD